jgi:hypothetical protein
MAFTPGFKAHILLDNAAGTPVDVSVYADDFSFPQNTELLDTTVFGTAGFKRVIPGLTGGDSISFSGPLDTVVFTLVYSPAGSVASAPKISGEVYVGEFSISSGVAGRNEFSASLQVDGAITNSAW